MVFNFFSKSCSLCDEYETIAEKALATPANTEELMELKSFVEKVFQLLLQIVSEQ